MPTRLPGGAYSDGSPVWSPDGRRIAYSSEVAFLPSIYIREADGGGEPSFVGPVGEYASYPTDWSADGKLIAYSTLTDGEVIRLLPIDADGVSRPYAEGPGDQENARFSPDGRWIAFTSSELGSTEVFVAPLADGNARLRVSVGGGESPVWNPDGRELFYTQGGTVYAARFSGETGAIGAAHELFSLRNDLSIDNMDITPDGERLLVAVMEQNLSTRITIVLDWDGLLAR